MKESNVLESAPPSMPGAEMVLPTRTISSGGASTHSLPAPVFVDDGLNFDNVFRIYVTRQTPDYGNPWLTSGISDSTGSGVVVQTENGELCILTAAHVVAYQTFIQVQRSGILDPNKYIAKVHAICHDCDLALLKVATSSDGSDAGFWKGIEPATIGQMPPLRSVVLTAGSPIGGEQISITEGVVSRIEGQRYFHSNRELLAITVDAAINSGSSGGPVFNTNGELVGVAFQSLQHASSVGHIIPPPVLRHFLRGVAKAGPERYQGFPSLGLEVQELTNGNLRKHFNLDKEVHGVLVSKVVYNSSCDGFIKEHDVLTHVGGHPVANNETVAYNGCGRIKAPIIFQMNQCGEKVTLGIIRKGEKMEIEVVAKPEETLVARSRHDQWPMYFIYCGFVFQRLSIHYIDTQTPGFSQYERLVENSKLMTKDWRQVCIVSKVLSDEVNVGYEELRYEQIKKFNGISVPDFPTLVQMIEEAPDDFFCLETCCGESIILPSPSNQEAIDANERIMANYHVSVDRRL